MALLNYRIVFPLPSGYLHVDEAWTFQNQYVQNRTQYIPLQKLFLLPHSPSQLVTVLSIYVAKLNESFSVNIHVVCFVLCCSFSILPAIPLPPSRFIKFPTETLPNLPQIIQPLSTLVRAPRHRQTYLSNAHLLCTNSSHSPWP